MGRNNPNPSAESGGDKNARRRGFGLRRPLFSCFGSVRLCFLVLGRPRCFSVPAVSVTRRLITHVRCPFPSPTPATHPLRRPAAQNFYDFAADSPPRNESKRGLLRLRRGTHVRGGEKSTKTTGGECRCLQDGGCDGGRGFSGVDSHAAVPLPYPEPRHLAPSYLLP